MKTTTKFDKNGVQFKGINITSLCAMLSSSLFFFPQYFHFIPLLIFTSCCKIYDLMQADKIEQEQKIWKASSLICLWVFAAMSPLSDVVLGGALSLTLSLLGNEMLLKSIYHRAESYVRPIYVEVKQWVDDTIKFHPNPLALCMQIIGLMSLQLLFSLLFFNYYFERFGLFNRTLMNFKAGDLVTYYWLKTESAVLLGLWACLVFFENIFINLGTYIRLQWAQEYKEYIYKTLFDGDNHVYMNLHKVEINGEWNKNQVGGTILFTTAQLIKNVFYFLYAFINIVTGIVICVNLSRISLVGCGLALLMSSIEILQPMVNYFGGLNELQASMAVIRNDLPNKINNALSSSYYLYNNKNSLLQRVTSHVMSQLKKLNHLRIREVFLRFLRILTQLLSVDHLQSFVLLPWVLQGQLNAPDLLLVTQMTWQIKRYFNAFFSISSRWSDFLVNQSQVSALLNQSGNPSNALSSSLKVLGQEEKDKGFLVVEEGGLSIYKSNQLSSVNEAVKSELLIYFDQGFSFPTNSYILFKGENGAGKSTFLKLLSGALNTEDKARGMYNQPGLFYQGDYKVPEHILSVSQQGNGERIWLPDATTMNHRIDVLISKNVSDWDKVDQYKPIYDWAVMSVEQGGLGLSDMNNKKESSLSGGEVAKCEMIKVLCQLEDLSGQAGSIMILLDEIVSPASGQSVTNFRQFLTHKLKHEDLRDRVTVVEISHRDKKVLSDTFTHCLTIGHDKQVVLTEYPHESVPIENQRFAEVLSY